MDLGYDASGSEPMALTALGIIDEAENVVACTILTDDGSCAEERRVNAAP